MANFKLRQEINILDAVLSAAGGASATSNEIVQLDTTQYVSPTYYFEAVGDSSVSISFNITLRRKGTSTDDATCNIPVLTTSFKRVRSASFTPPAGQTEYVVFIDATAGATKNVNAARIIILDTAATLTKTETQIEIGGPATSTSTAVAPAATITNPKYWTYTAANWDGVKTFVFEAVTKATSSKNVNNAVIQEDDGNFANWTDIQNTSSSSTTPERLRTAAFTPTDGRHYRVALTVGSSKSAMTLYSAKIIVDQSSNPTKLEPQYLLLNTADSGTGQQFMMTLWDSTEWSADAGTIAYKYSHDATNAADASKLIDIDNGSADVTGATVTGANQQISSAFTMPTTGHQVDTNVTVSTGVVGAVRVLVVYAYVATGGGGGTTVTGVFQTTNNFWGS